MADFVAVEGYGLQVQYDASKLEFIEVRTDQLLEGRATPQVLADEAGVLTVAAYGDVVSDGEMALSLVFRPTTEIENTVVEIIDSQTYDSEVGFNRLALPAPVQLQTMSGCVCSWRTTIRTRSTLRRRSSMRCRRRRT